MISGSTPATWRCSLFFPLFAPSITVNGLKLATAIEVGTNLRTFNPFILFLDLWWLSYYRRQPEVAGSCVQTYEQRRRGGENQVPNCGGIAQAAYLQGSSTSRSSVPISTLTVH
ncbi:hypothetical protein GGR56DRAFT_159802 [Xylariaceae sp. FL0804]|nr:hypothetical protein GGR56DRAFT_159802 [Xylariaceae sp. FL0804]